MVQIAGSYKLEQSENLAECLKTLGLPDELIEKANDPDFTSEVTVDGKNFSLKNSSKIDLSFTLEQEFDEPMPSGITLKSTAKLDGNKLSIISKSPDGGIGTRTYEFTDKGYTVTFTDGAAILATRQFVRV